MAAAPSTPLLRARRTAPWLLASGTVVVMLLAMLPAASGVGTAASRGAVVAPAASPGTPGPALLAEARASLAAGDGPAAAPVHVHAQSRSKGPGTALASIAPATPWTGLFGSNAPSARSSPAMTYDVADGYVLYFGGGWNGYGSNETWSYSGGNWTNLTATVGPAPPARTGASLAYDGADGYAVLFGGYAGPAGANGSLSHVLNDTWTYRAGSWTNVTSGSPTAPPARFDAGMTYDWNDGYVLLFGGATANGNPLGDTWSFAAGTWTNRTATVGTAPEARSYAAMADDPHDGVVVLYGGYDQANGTVFGDTWTYAGGNWTAIAPSASPPALRAAGLAYDPGQQELVLFGGASYGFSGYGGPFQPSNQTWTFAGGTWTNVTGTIASSPDARYLAGITNTSDPNVLLMADGCVAQGCAASVDLADAWTYDASGTAGLPWVPVGAYVQPSERQSSAITYDAADGYVLFFGGGWNGGTSINDTWTFQNGTWTNITASLARSPGPRESPLMAYDAKDGYVVLFGGYTTGGLPYNGGSNSYVLNDTWTYHAGVWTKLALSHHPSGRFAGQMTYDWTDGYVLLFGGEVLNGPVLNDTWTFSGGNWTELKHLAVSPPGRDFATLVDDPEAGYVVLFGGYDIVNGTIFNDTWAFAAGNWTQLSPANSPGPLRGANAAYDPVGGYILLYGGTTYQGYDWPFGPVSQTWAFKNDNWTDLTPALTTQPPPRMLGAMTNVSSTGELVMADGCLLQGCPYGTDISDTWIYNWSNISGTFANLEPLHLRSIGSFVYRVEGGTGTYTYQYTGLPPGCSSVDSAFLNCTPTYGGRYTIVGTVSDADGHHLSLSLNVTIVEAPRTLAVGLSENVTDVGLPVTLSAAAQGGAGGPWTYAYTGLPDGCASADTTNLSCDPSASGTYAVQVTATDAQGGTVAGALGLTVHPHLGLRSSLSAPLIELSQGVDLNAVASYGTPPYTYAWSGVPTGCPGQSDFSTIDCVPSAAGTWNVSVVVTDAIGQKVGSSTMTLAVAPLPTLSLAAPSAIAGTTGGFVFTAEPTGGIAPYLVTWYFGDGTTATGLTVSHTYGTAGTYEVYVTVSDDKGFQSSADEQVAFTAAPSGNGGGGGGGGGTGSHGTPKLPSVAPAGLTFLDGLLAGLLGLVLVGAWALDRQRRRRDGAALVAALERPRSRGPRPGSVAPPEAPENSS